MLFELFSVVEMWVFQKIHHFSWRRHSEPSPVGCLRKRQKTVAAEAYQHIRDFVQSFDCFCSWVLQIKVKRDWGLAVIFPQIALAIGVLTSGVRVCRSFEFVLEVYAGIIIRYKDFFHFSFGEDRFFWLFFLKWVVQPPASLEMNNYNTSIELNEFLEFRVRSIFNSPKKISWLMVHKAFVAQAQVFFSFLSDKNIQEKNKKECRWSQFWDDHSAMGIPIFWTKTGWWFHICFYFHPYLGKIPIVTNIFKGVVQPPTRRFYNNLMIRSFTSPFHKLSLRLLEMTLLTLLTNSPKKIQHGKMQTKNRDFFLEGHESIHLFSKDILLMEEILHRLGCIRPCK